MSDGCVMMPVTTVKGEIMQEIQRAQMVRDMEPDFRGGAMETGLAMVAAGAGLVGAYGAIRGARAQEVQAGTRKPPHQPKHREGK